MTDHSRLAVVPAMVVFEGIQLQNGAMLAVELEHPSQRFAVVHDADGLVEVLSLHGTEKETIHRLEKIVCQMEAMALSMGGQQQPRGRETLQ